MDENLEVVEVKEELVQEKPEPTKEEKMKSAYKRCGFGLLALYGIAAVISSVVITIFAIIGAVSMFMDPEFLALLQNIDFEGVEEVVGMLLSNDTFLSCIVLGLVIGTGGGFFVAGLILKKIMPKPVEPIEKKNLSFGQFLLVMMIAFGVWGFGIYIGQWTDFVYPVNSGNILELVPGKLLIPYFLYAMIGAPLVEEFIFRKVMMDSLHKYGQTVAAFVSGLTFGLIHGNSAQFIFAFMLGLLFATVYMKTGKVIYTMLLHAIINTTATIPNLISLATDGKFDEEVNTGLFLLIAVLGVAGLIVMFVGRKNEILKLEKPECQGTNALVFKNAGMVLMVVLGLVQLVATDLLTIVSDLINNMNPMVFLRLLSTALAVVMVILTTKTVGKHSKEPVEIVAE